MISTGSEENCVEIIGQSFTKLLQTRTYNTLHTWAAKRKTFTRERVSYVFVVK